jgi:hypothetical protein
VERLESRISIALSTQVTPTTDSQHRPEDVSGSAAYRVETSSGRFLTWPISSETASRTDSLDRSPCFLALSALYKRFLGTSRRYSAQLSFHRRRS